VIAFLIAISEGIEMGYDVIGDIHGQGGKLEALLTKLGYVKRATSWVAPIGRQAIFIGDLIDRGPDQVVVVDTVRRMIDSGHARAVMGNHEFNAIGFATEVPDAPGRYLRRHSSKNIEQHEEFLRQVGEGSVLHREMVAWFKTLPPTLDLSGIRAVHAWWHQPYVDRIGERLAGGRPMDDEFLVAAYRRGSDEHCAMEGLTKGLEVTLPDGGFFLDYHGVERREIRTKWWLEEPKTLRDVAILKSDQVHRVPDHPLPSDFAGKPVEGSPVFFGHYWFSGTPELLSRKAVCVDYSAADTGPLVCYRWSGEQELDLRNFVQAGGPGQSNAE
jgi:SAM-dependent methyltransferase